MNNKIFELQLQKSNIRTSHIFHFILTCLTGIWLFVWVTVVFYNRNKIKDIEKQILIEEQRGLL